MNCIIVDDNLMARMAMRKLIEQVKDLSVVAECENAMAAYNIVNQKPVDVLFLDIEMPGMTGIELTKNLQKKSPFIIFTTAKPDYAVDAFELNVIDYLVKPIEPARFLNAVDRLKEALKIMESLKRLAQMIFNTLRRWGITWKFSPPKSFTLSIPH